MKASILILLNLLSLNLALAEDFTSQKGDAINDGFFHVSMSVFYAPDGTADFTNYLDGTSESNSVNSGTATVSVGSFKGGQVELVFFTPPGGFSFGYAKDGDHEIQHTEITYKTGSSTLSRTYPYDILNNESFLFNYFLTRTPNRGYWTFGCNLSNPRWKVSTPTNETTTIDGDIGLQMNFGMALVRGFLFDIGFRSTGIKLKHTRPDGTFDDYGSGAVTNSTFGFKFIF